MPNQTKYKVYIAIYKGDPLDYSKWRHTGLWFVPEQGSTNYFYHVKGLTGEFEFERRKNFDPTTSRTFAKKVKVGKTKHSVVFAEIDSLMRSVQVSNSDPEFNCQQWVHYALQTLYHAGHITSEQYDNGLNDMIDATMEAEDEDNA